MTYIPQAGDRVFLRGRPNTEVEVLAVDLVSQTMWVRTQGAAKPLSAPITDQWVQVVPHPPLPDVWHVATSTAVSRGFPSRAVVMSNLPAGAVALLHVNPSGSVDIEWLPAPVAPPPDPVPPPTP